MIAAIVSMAALSGLVAGVHVIRQYFWGEHVSLQASAVIAIFAGIPFLYGLLVLALMLGFK